MCVFVYACEPGGGLLKKIRLHLSCFCIRKHSWQDLGIQYYGQAAHQMGVWVYFCGPPSLLLSHPATPNSPLSVHPLLPIPCHSFLFALSPNCSFHSFLTRLDSYITNCLEITWLCLHVDRTQLFISIIGFVSSLFFFLSSPHTFFLSSLIICRVNTHTHRTKLHLR